MNRRFQSPVWAVLSLAVVSFGLSGCGQKGSGSGQAADPGEPREVSRVVAAEAETYMSDAMFALQIKDFARAEQSLAKAVKLRDDIPDWWVNLGIARKRLGQKGDAKSAYKKALALHEKAYDKSKDPRFVDGQIYLLLLLGEEKEARSLLDKAIRNHPDSQDLLRFRDAKGIDLLLRDPRIVENQV